MHISAVRIRNFRNFADFAVSGLGPGTVVVGRNNVGKSNLLHALRLVLDPSLPDTARTLQGEDFWDGGPAYSGAEIEVAIELSGFAGDEDVEAVLADYVTSRTPLSATIRYLFRPKPRPDAVDLSQLRAGEYEYTVTGGERGVPISNAVRRMAQLRVLPALRDAEGDLQVWARSPLRSLLEQLDIAETTLDGVARAVQASTDTLLTDPAVATLDTDISRGVTSLVGPTFAISTQLGLASSDAKQVLRSVRLLVEAGRPIGRTGLGAANVLFIALLLEDLRRREAKSEIASWITAVEEPEAHLHPHVQREVFRTLLSRSQGVILTTHSPQIVSVSPIDGLLHLRSGPTGTVGAYSGNAPFTVQEKRDLERYLDAVTADFVFARGVILVEGAAELWLVPAAGAAMGIDLNSLGITVCPVHGTNFKPFHVLLGPQGLAIPVATLTDGDPETGAEGTNRLADGLTRGLRLLPDAERAAAETEAVAGNEDALRARLRQRGVFVGDVTLEADIAMKDPEVVLETFDELVESEVRRQRFRALMAAMATDPSADRQVDVVNAIARVGKGRFAQRLATHLREASIPDYLSNALSWLRDGLV